MSIDADNTDSQFIEYHKEGLFGKSEFDDNEHALSLKYSESRGERAGYGSRVKFSLRMKNPHILKENQSYMVITYKTNITSKHGKIRLMLGNYWGECLTLEPDVSVSNGKYIRSNPINIHVLRQPRQDYFDRLRRPHTQESLYTAADLIYISTYDSSGVQTFPYFEILCNAGGTADVVVHATECEIRSGDIVIVPPLCSHNVSSKNTAVTMYSIKFQPEYLHAYGVPFPIMRSRIYELQEQLRNAPFIGADEAHKRGLDKLIEDLISFTGHASFSNQVKIHATLLTFFSIIWDRFEVEKADISSSAPHTSLFAHAIEEAQKNLCNFNTSDAAKISNLSYNYFCSGFKKEYGMSFSAYLDSLRLNESTRLLLTTDMSITEIAATVGFSDICHYIRKFKLAYNITPHKYRDRAKKRS